jgi:peptidoglycan/LPS O-acetylase OafA/YrhL
MGITDRVSPPPRLPGLDGLRGLAAIGVVAVHVWMYTENTHGRERWPLLDAAIGELRLGLMFFFVVSGFLLAGPWVRAALEGKRRPRLGRFTRQRAARVLPAYLVALVGAFAVLYGTGHAREVGLEALPVFALFAQNHFDATAGQLNPPTWSLAVEVGFYLVLPIVGWAFVRARTRARLVAICVAVIGLGLAWCAAGYLGDWPATTMTSVPTFLPVFGAGVLASVLACGRQLGRRAALALMAAGWVVVVTSAWWHAIGDTGVLGHTVRDLPAALGFGAIIVGLCARPPGVLDLWPVRQLGVISYGLYLWHMPVLYWLKTRGVFPEDFGLAYAAVLVPAIALGAASWLAVERPFVRTRRTPTAPKRRPVPALEPGR